MWGILAMPARTVVVKKNEFSDAMYIIANGEVEVEIKPKPRTPVLLRTGNVFGEAGLLENKKRNATVRTVRASKFLVLEMRDFHRVASGHPFIRAPLGFELAPKRACPVAHWPGW